MIKKSGFDRLKGAAATACVASAGMFGAVASLRAADRSFAVVFTVTKVGTDNRSYKVSAIHNTHFFDKATLAAPYSSKQIPTGPYLGISSIRSFTNTNSQGVLFNAHDAFYAFNVMGTAFVSAKTTIDLTDNVATSDTITDIAPGIDASLQWTFLSSTSGVRGILTLTNTTGNDISGPVMALGDVGSNNVTTIHATSSGDKVLDDTDLWVMSNDNKVVDGEPSEDPVIVFGIQGSEKSIADATELLGYSESKDQGRNEDQYVYQYNVTVPANSTIRIMNLMHMDFTNAQAITEAANFESRAALQEAGYLDGLSTDEINSIVNYFGGEAGLVAKAKAKAVAVARNSSSGSGSFGGAALLSLLGLAGLRRRRNR